MEEILQSINVKMNVIISLLLASQKPEDKKITDSEIIKKFIDAGLNNADVGQILGKSAKQVRDLLYLYNKKKK